MKKLVLDDGAANSAEEAIAIFQDDAFIRIAIKYTTLILMPPLLAQRLRARGDQKASARDFECGCLTSTVNDRPQCKEVFADCRFAGEPPCETSAGDPDAALNLRRPHTQMLVKFLRNIVVTYQKAAPATRADMLVFMSASVEKRVRGICKNRRPGKLFATEPCDERAADAHEGSNQK